LNEDRTRSNKAQPRLDSFRTRLNRCRACPNADQARSNRAQPCLNRDRTCRNEDPARSNKTRTRWDSLLTRLDRDRPRLNSVPTSLDKDQPCLDKDRTRLGSLRPGAGGLKPPARVAPRLLPEAKRGAHARSGTGELSRPAFPGCLTTRPIAARPDSLGPTHPAFGRLRRRLDCCLFASRLRLWGSRSTLT
jgi:hypothetical protein